MVKTPLRVSLKATRKHLESYSGDMERTFLTVLSAVLGNLNIIDYVKHAIESFVYMLIFCLTCNHYHK